MDEHDPPGVAEPAEDDGGRRADLLVLAALVHAADTRISRTTESQDTWTREICLLVPVSNTQRVVVDVGSGTYDEIDYVPPGKPFITIRGEDRDATVIEYPNNDRFNVAPVSNADNQCIQRRLPGTPDLYNCWRSLFGVEATSASVERVMLDETSWVDVARGWLAPAESEQLFAELRDGVAWQTSRLFRYDHFVEERRLGSYWRAGRGLPLPSPALGRALRGLFVYAPSILKVWKRA